MFLVAPVLIVALCVGLACVTGSVLLPLGIVVFSAINGFVTARS